MTTEIELSDNILIPCPETGFALRRVIHCIKCPHYKGIVRATENGKTIIPPPGAEAEYLQVKCGRPVTRKLIKVFD